MPSKPKLWIRIHCWFHVGFSIHEDAWYFCPLCRQCDAWNRRADADRE